MAGRSVHKLEPINKKEVAWIERQISAATEFVAQFSPADACRQSPPLAVLDRAWAAWIHTKPSGGTVINDVINCVGVSFGQSLVTGAGFTWVIATDEYGTELAIHALPNRGDVLIFPANFVAKRWERREINFLEDAYRRIFEDVRKAARSWQGPNPG